MSLETYRQHLGDIKAAIAPKPDKLRFINWYLFHECNNRCHMCRVPSYHTPIMSADQRQEAFGKLQQISIPGAVLSIIGGEPTVRPNLVLEAVKDATAAGFFACLVTNGSGLNTQLIEDLSDAGLKNLGISVDLAHGDNGLEKALSYLGRARARGIIPVVNTVIARDTDLDEFRRITDRTLDEGFFINPMACSPEVPGGRFSNASPDSVPTPGQLKEIIPWIVWRKLQTGRVTSSYNYLRTLYKLREDDNGNTQRWHCAPHFRRDDVPGSGKGFASLDSDGQIGPCQEFPRVTNLLGIPSDALSLRALDPQFSQVATGCPGCLFNCYHMEETTRGISALMEVPRSIPMADVLSRRIPPPLA